MTQQEQKEKLSEFQEKMNETITSKASDYATSDVLSNFKLVAQITNLSVEKVIDVFLATKVVRKCNLTGSQASNESTDDTLLDLANYSFLSTLKDDFKIKEISPNEWAICTDGFTKRNNEIKVGDTVEILKPIDEDDYPTKWVDEMTEMIGKQYKVTLIRKSKRGDYNIYTIRGLYFVKESLKKIK